MSSAMPDRSDPLRLLRCQALICWPILRPVTHGGREVHEEPPLAFGPATPKGVAEEIEAGVRRIPSAARVLAVHDLRLVGVQLKPDRLEPFGEVGQELSLIHISEPTRQ